jgi:hypothetical protein
MFKVIAYLMRKPGISREEFKQNYETKLVPHMRKNFPIVKYVRNYIDPSVAVVIPGATLPTFDAITEIYFKDQAGFEAMMGAMADPKIFGEVDAIEKTFLDTTKTCLVKVEECGDI